MAAKKKKSTRTAKAPKKAKRPAKTPKRKTAARKAAPRKAAPRKAKKAAPATRTKAKKTTPRKKKSLFARAVGEVTNLLTGHAKKAPNTEFGEGNYKASKRFREDQEAFVKNNKSRIPAMGRAAEDALDGPEGDSLRAAEAAAAGHAAGQPEE